MTLQFRQLAGLEKKVNKTVSAHWYSPFAHLPDAPCLLLHNCAGALPLISPWTTALCKTFRKGAANGEWMKAFSSRVYWY